MVEPIPIGPNRWVVKLTDDWIPIPDAALKELGWSEGTELEVVPIYNNQVVIRRKGALSDEPKEGTQGSSKGRD